MEMKLNAAREENKFENCETCSAEEARDTTYKLVSFSKIREELRSSARIQEIGEVPLQLDEASIR